MEGHRDGVAFDVDEVRAQFPILRRPGPPLVYLDHGASTHAPQPVLDAVVEFLSHSYANVHRGNHALSLAASQRFEDATQTLLNFVGADLEESTLVYGQNTTMALDLAAHVMARTPGATLTTLAEHHSNELPHRRRGRVVHADVDAEGRILLDSVRAALEAEPIRLVAVTGASNVTGQLPDLGRLARITHDASSRLLVDAAQLLAHRAIDMKPAGHPEHIDFLAAAGHKAYAPVGSAFLIGPKEVMNAAPPYIPGGGTVRWVTENDVLHTTGADRHVGGTPNIVGAIAFAAALDFLDGLGMAEVERHEAELVRHTLARLSQVEGLTLLGPKSPHNRLGVFSFLVRGVSHPEVSAALDREFGIATRNGCFCAQPLLNRLLGLGAEPAWTRKVSRGEPVELPGATRATFGVYNTVAEVDLLCAALETIAARGPGGYRMGADGVCRPVNEPVAAPQITGEGSA
ncbi:MAG: aminotransferase class V-fold PLP-dependent enzyme [Thermoplasmatota archaeon]